MDFFNRNRFLLAAIMLLVALNIGTLLMLILDRRGAGAPPRNMPAEQEQRRITQLLEDELGFNRDQLARYIELRKAHQARIAALDARMRGLKTRMFDDVLRDDPAPALSDSLLLSTQQTQNEIERLTFRHLLELKQLCTPEQRERLHTIIHEMFRKGPRGTDAGPAPAPHAPRNDGPPSPL